VTTETSTATMRAFALDAFGAPSTGTIRTVPKPQVGEGEILIAVHATGVNPSDLGIISGFAKDMMATTMNTADPEVLGGLGVEGTNVNGAMISTPADLDALAELVTTGQLTVPIAHIFALEEAPRAFERLQSGEVQGKLVLDCRTA
jgi:NADPH:quinone reductase-like Zn-dependent oxidoreductase